MSSVNLQSGVLGSPLNTAGLEEGEGIADVANGADGDAASAEQVSAQDLTDGSPSSVDPSARRFAPDAGSYLAASGSIAASGAASADSAGDGANASGAGSGRGGSGNGNNVEAEILDLMRIFTTPSPGKGEDWPPRRTDPLGIPWLRTLDGSGNRYLALNLLSRHNTPEVRAAIAQVMLSDPDLSLRAACAEKLSVFGTPDVARPLMRLAFEESDKNVQLVAGTAAMRALAMAGICEAMPHFIKILQMRQLPDGPGEHMPLVAMQGIYALAVLEDLNRMLRTSSPIPDEFKTAHALPALLDVIARPFDDHLLYAAVETVGMIGEDNDEVIETLTSLIESECQARRIAAVRALAQIGGMKAERLLIEAMQDTNETLRAEAVTGIGKNGATSALQDLRNLLDDPSADVRVAVVVAIGKLGSEEYLEILLRAAQSDYSEDVRSAAREALEELVRRTKHTVPGMDMLDAST